MRNLHIARSFGALILIGALLCAGLSGCLQKSESVLMICSEEEGFYWRNLIEGARQAAVEKDVTLVVHLLEKGENVQELIDRAENQSDYRVILALDGKQAPTDIFAAQGLVIAGYQFGEPETVDSRISSRESIVGAMQGYFIKRDAGLQIRAMIVTGEEEYLYTDPWETSLRSVAGMGGISFAARVVSSGEPEEVYRACKQALENHPDIQAIACQNEQAAVAALRAAEALGVHPMILAKDMNAEIARGIDEKTIAGSYVTNSYSMGYMALVDAVDPMLRRGSKTVDAIYVNKEIFSSGELDRILFPVE